MSFVEVEVDEGDGLRWRWKPYLQVVEVLAPEVGFRMMERKRVILESEEKRGSWVEGRRGVVWVETRE